MNDPRLHRLLAQARMEELRRLSAHHVPRSLPEDSRPAPVELAVTLRYGFPDDAEAIARLATLDSSLPPAPPILLAEVAGELRAALSLRDGTVVADPFHRTGGLVDLLRARAVQLIPTGMVRASFRHRLLTRLALAVGR